MAASLPILNENFRKAGLYRIANRVANALQEQGYYLAQGKRGFVAVDLHGEVYSLTRQLGQKKKALEARLGKVENLPSVAEIKTTIHGRLSTLFKSYTDDLARKHRKETQPLKAAKLEMVAAHRQERAKLRAAQQERWQTEELRRSSRIRKGLQGIMGQDQWPLLEDQKTP